MFDDDDDDVIVTAHTIVSISTRGQLRVRAPLLLHY